VGSVNVLAGKAVCPGTALLYDMMDIIAWGRRRNGALQFIQTLWSIIVGFDDR
jgi:hypothetical protein